MMPAMHTITLYGIRNCDTVRKARQWLTEHERPYQFHDFKTSGVPPERLAQWLQQLPWEILLNRQGNAWRALDEATRASVVDAASAAAVMRAQPSTIKRPVVEWNTAPAGEVTVGFKPELWAERLARTR